MAIGKRWTNCISHGELLRAGFDQKLEVGPANLRVLFQGVTDRARAGIPYGQIPWRLGILAPDPPKAGPRSPRRQPGPEELGN